MAQPIILSDNSFSIIILHLILLFPPLECYKFGVFGVFRLPFFPLLFLPLGRHKLSVFGEFRLLFFPLLFLPLGRHKFSVFGVFRLPFIPLSFSVLIASSI